MHYRWLILSVWIAACGGSAPPPVTPTPKPVAVRRPPAIPRPQNTLYRDEVLEVSRVGLGHVFELIELEPVGDLDARGKIADFKGFQIRALRPAEPWLSFDFAPGDILTHINGVSVEHYSTWFEQFEGLPKADQIRVDLIRDGNPKTVIVKIMDRPGASPKPSATQPTAGVPSQTPSKAKPDK